VFQADRLNIHHYEPGEIIVRKGEIGRELYMIRAGEVEVFDPSAAGGPISKLGPRDVFGERALLVDTKRSASVRAVGQVDVVVVSRRDFRSLVEQFPVLDEHFGKLLRERHPQMLEGRALMDCMPPS
jgi:CRP-like cAMP-binding protein